MSGGSFMKKSFLVFWALQFSLATITSASEYYDLQNKETGSTKTSWSCGTCTCPALPGGNPYTVPLKGCDPVNGGANGVPKCGPFRSEQQAINNCVAAWTCGPNKTQATCTINKTTTYVPGTSEEAYE